MAPFPEEVDVFTVPHSRMKNLVKGYSEKLNEIDFTDTDSLEPLLSTLINTFREFKCHEQIENQYIMKRLKKKMKALHITDAAVCNCHSDNRLSDILCLLTDGYSRCSSTDQDLDGRLEYGRKLQQALIDFTQDFLPHMKEEEEVFQPMLVKYFEYDELRTLKEIVIQEHFKSQLGTEPVVSPAAPVCPTLPEKDVLIEKCCLETEKELVVAAPDKLSVLSLPAEVMQHVFSYLPPQELICCAAVCRKWRDLAYHPSLWKVIQPSCWAQGKWEDEFDIPLAPYRPLCIAWDEDADLDESSEGCSSDGEDHPVVAQRKLLRYLAQSLLPLVGSGVRKLVLSGYQSISASLFRSILALCPNIVHLDLSYSSMTDSAFKGLHEHVTARQLKWLSLAGCVKITDYGMARLALYLSPSTLLHLSLSGCYLISDIGLSYLKSKLRVVESMDLSGCWKLTGAALVALAHACPHLRPGDLSYCDFITDGPYPSTANGCQNLETPLCCRCCCGNGDSEGGFCLT